LGLLKIAEARVTKEEDRFIIGEVIIVDSFKSCTGKEKLFV
jgi:hypothetical protein